MVANEIYALSEAYRRLCEICARYEPSAMDSIAVQRDGDSFEWPGRIFVDNAAGVSFQNGTNPNSKLKGIFDLREQWVKELRDKQRVKAVQISTDKCG